MIEEDISVSAALGPSWTSECNAKSGQHTFDKHLILRWYYNRDLIKCKNCIKCLLTSI